MGAKWRLTVNTSLPKVCYGKQDLRKEIFTFGDFETARREMRSKLHDFAFSRNAMFDGYGNIIHMEKYMDRIKREDGALEEEPLRGWLDGGVAVTLLKIVSCILEGNDVDFDFACGSYFNADIEAVLHRHSVAVCGTGEGAYNGYAPKIDTNMLTMQEEQDYHIYIDDMFGQWSGVSAELYMDLEKLEQEQLSFL